MKNIDKILLRIALIGTVIGIFWGINTEFGFLILLVIGFLIFIEE